MKTLTLLKTSDYSRYENLIKNNIGDYHKLCNSYIHNFELEYNNFGILSKNMYGNYSSGCLGNNNISRNRR